MRGMCCIEGCEKEVQVPSTGTCRNCYSSILRWSKRSREDIMRRAGTIGLYSNRMQLLIPRNVDIMRPKKVTLKGMPGEFRVKKQPQGKGRKRKAG